MKQPKQKILLILQLPPPVHGASLMNQHIVKSELLRNTYDLQVINLKFSDSIKNLEKFSVGKLLITFTYAWLIVKKVISHRPDLVYFTLSPRGFAFYRDAFYVFLLKMFRQKIVYHLHGKGIEKTAKQHLFSQLIARWMFKNTSVICMSQKLTEDVATVYKAKPYIVPYGIAVQQKNERVEVMTQGLKRKEKSEVPRILYLANYIKTKGILDLIEALKILQDQGVLYRARLVGAPGDLSIDYLEKHLQKLALSENVKIVGPRYDEDKFAEFRQADIFVFPTYYGNEAFPLVNLEAMQFGLPVISTVEGGIPDMFVDHESGYIIETQQPKILAEKMAILLKDKVLRLAMGKKSAERFAAHFTLGHFERNIVKAINNMLSAN